VAGGNFEGEAAAGPTDLLGPNFEISSGPTVFGPSDAAYSPVARKFLVVWTDNRNESSTSADIYGALVSTEGVAGPAFPISTAAAGQRFPTVTYNPQADRFLVVWTDFRTCPPDSVFGDHCTDLYGQLVKSDGTPDGGEFAITTAPNDQRSQDVSYNSLTNTFLVVWEDNRATPLTCSAA
jgi:hypothetical protein